VVSTYGYHAAGFEIVECLRKVLTIGLPTILFQPGSWSQLLFGLLVCFLFYGLYTEVHPFRERSSNLLMTLAQLEIFLMLLCSIILAGGDAAKNEPFVTVMLQVFVTCVPVVAVLGIVGDVIGGGCDTQMETFDGFDGFEEAFDSFRGHIASRPVAAMVSPQISPFSSPFSPRGAHTFDKESSAVMAASATAASTPASPTAGHEFTVDLPGSPGSEYASAAAHTDDDAIVGAATSAAVTSTTADDAGVDGYVPEADSAVVMRSADHAPVPGPVPFEHATSSRMQPLQVAELADCGLVMDVYVEEAGDGAAAVQTAPPELVYGHSTFL